MIYYISASKLAECMKEANLQPENLRFYTKESMEIPRWWPDPQGESLERYLQCPEHAS